MTATSANKRQTVFMLHCQYIFSLPLTPVSVRRVLMRRMLTNKAILMRSLTNHYLDMKLKVLKSSPYFGLSSGEKVEYQNLLKNLSADLYGPFLTKTLRIHRKVNCQI